ncbi:MAG: hypothetical protein DLM69_00170 [Candidatus Chloroheliales bacterium]|nr:MAG: hypothetical protein DLM69_00170 [Chloroflexota bacterium]
MIPGDFDILTVGVVGVVVGLVALLAALLVRLRLEQRGYRVQKLVQVKQHVAFLATTYIKIGDRQAELEPRAALY